ncbi:response regulator [Paracraurococcus lichenis]|uniref:Response regulator n=1 Tax=Paracraurococcus lichenis TaxID=3064888 RepID=A0ABT9E6I6_9PROT|nr:response regulator [Paracraurococcus sp. LOR1-02]MDO9711759.1 response regulator [Paracraurococcus sp. LOR1-02]
MQDSNMIGWARPLALIVEDDALLTLLADGLLAAEGFDTIFAAHETEAMVQAAVAGRIAVAVVDLSLDGDVAGQRVIRALRQHVPDLPVVVITGFDSDAPEANLRGLGWPTVRLHKPGGYDELIPAVLDVMEQARTGAWPKEWRRDTDYTY